MSVCLCELCERMVDTDYDPDSLYVVKYPDKCVCEWCRDQEDLKTEFDE